jgi:hypothetical protein
MKVWVVTKRWVHEDRMNVAVFSTEAAAYNFVRDNETDDNWRVCFDVEDWEVDSECKMAKACDIIWFVRRSDERR